MIYAFTAEAKTKDRTLHSYFEASDARECRAAWQGVAGLLRNLKFACMIEDYSMEADKNTADTWKDRGYI